MPFYEYQCQACGAQAEVLQKISDGPLKKCPDCGKSKMVKLVSAPVFRLKGGGWYETDFKSDQDKKRNLVGEEAKEEKKDEPKKEESKKEEPKKEEAKKDEPKKDAKGAESKAKPATKPKKKLKKKR